MTRPVPFFFERQGRACAAWLHRPEKTTGHGVVLCHPFGYEGICAHRSMRELAEALASAGVTVVRFDYDGTGDSEGDDRDPGRLAAWVGSIVGACEVLRPLVSRIDLVGVRLGALLATLATHEAAVDGLVAIAPVVSGRSYLRELAMIQTAVGLDERGTRGLAEGDREALGFVLTAETVADLGKVDLMQAEPPTAEVFVIDREDLASVGKWVQRLGCTFIQLPGYVEMMLDPHKAIVPHAIVRATVDWVVAHASSPGKAEPELSVEARMGGVLERPTFVDDHVFGVLAVPENPTGGAVLLLNAGSIHHIGPNRLHVVAARRWAKTGHLVLRMDLSGIGESPARPGEASNVVYGSHGVTDVLLAAAHLRTLGASSVRTIGLCAGAFHAQKAAAADRAIAGFIAINPLTFFRPTSGAVDFPAHQVAGEAERYRRSALDPEKWKKLLRRDVAFRAIYETFARRALGLFTNVGRELSRRASMPWSDDIGVELASLVARGVQGRFVFAKGDPGRQILREQGGSVVRALERKGALEVTVIDGPDHTFTPVWSHEPLLAALTRILAAS